MNKSKLFALIIGIVGLGLAGAVYAKTYSAHGSGSPVLEITKPAQPMTGIAPIGAQRVPFTKVDLTARGTDIQIDEITVAQTGFADDDALEDILFLDSNGEEITVPIIIPIGTTLHLTVAANIADDAEEFAGQVPSLTITNISASGIIYLKEN
ncbi:hypothetical protein K2Q08_03545 [Patescibacteria group bacterium]|nr:hypothetical protein [Patescibacteria group bacterium]